MQLKKRPLITTSVLLRGNDLDPDSVSDALGLQPGLSQKKGERRGGDRAGSRVYVTKIGTWWVWVDNKLLKEQDMIIEVPQLVDALLKLFSGRQAQLDTIPGVDEAYLDILIIAEKENEDSVDYTAEFTLRKDQIVRITELGLAICATVSYSENTSDIRMIKRGI